MKRFLYKVAPFAAISALLILLAGCDKGTHEAGKDRQSTRIEYAREELAAARQTLEDLDTDANRALWSQQVELLEKELENTERLAELEREAQAFAAKRRVNVDYALRQALSAVDTSTSGPLRDLKTLKSKLRRKKADRSKLVIQNEEAAKQKELSEEDERAQARRTSEIQNHDAEILALMLRVDGAELRLRLARDATRIDEFRSGLDMGMRPSISLLLEKWRAVRANKTTLKEYESFYESVQANRAETAAAVKITGDRFEHLDRKLQILHDSYALVRRAKTSDGSAEEHKNRVRRMKDRAESEKDLLGDRLKSVETQLEALDEAVNHTEQGRDMIMAEIAFREADIATLRSRYLSRVTIPILLIMILVLIHRRISQRVLPQFYESDALFVARRLGRYVLIMLIIVIFLMFFMDDLGKIATALGIVGAAVVIALQDLCSSFAGWFVIVASRRVRVGDRVEIAGQRGDVMDIELLRTTIMELNNWLGVDEPTGRIIGIPNSFIFKSAVCNYTHVHPFIWGKVDIQVTFETPPAKAHDTLLALLTEETKDEFEQAQKGGERMKKMYGKERETYEPRIRTFIEDSGDDTYRSRSGVAVAGRLEVPGGEGAPDR
jgi:small-conductance mechanosensitive channel